MSAIDLIGRAARLHSQNRPGRVYLVLRFYSLKEITIMASSSDARMKKRYTPAEIEAELAKEPQAAVKQTCQQLCDQLQNDTEILQSLEDYPANQRARIRRLVLQAMQLISRELKQQHCPECAF